MNPAASALCEEDEHAIAWLVRLRLGTGGPDAAQQLAAWRGADARHEAAWQRIAALQGGLTWPPGAGLAPAQAHAVLRATRRRPGQQGRRLCLAAMLGGIAFALRPADWLAGPGAPLARWDTAPGRTGRWRLDDGSVLHANANTQLALHADGAALRLVLQRGEIAWLRAGARGGAQAQVQTPQGRLLADANGQVADLLVRTDAGGTVLAVRGAGAQVLAAGEGGAHRLAAGGAQRLSATAAHEGTAWDWQGVDPWAFTDGVLAVRDTPLPVFAGELARHHARPIAWERALGALRVSGTFQLADLDGALDLLERLLPLRVSRQGGRAWLAVR